MALLRGTAVFAACTLLVLAGGSPASADTTVSADLESLNDSGASGTVTLTATEDGALTVAVRARGLVPGQPHAQHIHGSVGSEHFMCPTLSADTDGDGVLTNEEATGEYGTIFLALTTRGSVSPDSGLALDRMPAADADGRVDYERTFTPEQVPDGLGESLATVHIVLHGIDVNDNGKYDTAALGESTFAKNLGVPGVPEEATDPAACGVIQGAHAPTAPMGGVETGGEPAGRDLRVPMGLVGAGLLVGSAVVLTRRRPAGS